jgi:hypothetical protein
MMDNVQKHNICINEVLSGFSCMNTGLVSSDGSQTSLPPSSGVNALSITATQCIYSHRTCSWLFQCGPLGAQCTENYDILPYYGPMGEWWAGSGGLASQSSNDFPTPPYLSTIHLSFSFSTAYPLPPQHLV